MNDFELWGAVEYTEAGQPIKEVALFSALIVSSFYDLGNNIQLAKQFYEEL